MHTRGNFRIAFRVAAGYVTHLGLENAQRELHLVAEHYARNNDHEASQSRQISALIVRRWSVGRGALRSRKIRTF